MSTPGTFSMPLGPVHVALEEPVYFHLTVDGETIRKVELTSGHVHRGMEALASQRNLIKNTTLTERVCSLCSNSHSFTYSMAVENVLGMIIPPRARYLRVMAEEIKRVASHLFNIAIQAHIIGFKSLFMHVMEVRELMQDVKETVYGNRMNLASNCIGGVKCDVEPAHFDFIQSMLDKVEPAVEEIRDIYATDPLVLARTRGLGLLPTRTVFTGQKHRTQDTAAVTAAPFAGAALTGYQIHTGRTEVQGVPFCTLADGTPEGCVQDNVFGTYLHGLFDTGELTEKLVALLCQRKGIAPDSAALIPMEQYRQQQFDLLADGVRGALDLDAVYAAMGLENPRRNAQ